MALKVIRNKNRVPELIKQLQFLVKAEIHVGIFGEDDEHTLMIARVHEFGAQIRVTDKMRAWFAYQGHPLRKDTDEINIPERSYMRKAWEGDLQKKLDKAVKEAIDEVVFNGKKASGVLDKIGEIAVKDIQEEIRRLRSPRLSDMADHNNPLIDTGNLYNSITYKIRKG